VVRRVAKVEMAFFYSSGVWKSDDPGRVVGGGGANSILRFRLERRDDMMKCCRKIKRRQ
jgi:hypothetical protein